MLLLLLLVMIVYESARAEGRLRGVNGLIKP